MTAGESKVNLASYNGFVPDLQRRQLMNVVLVSTAGIPVLVALGSSAVRCTDLVRTGFSPCFRPKGLLVMQTILQ